MHLKAGKGEDGSGGRGKKNPRERVPEGLAGQSRDRVPVKERVPGETGQVHSRNAFRKWHR